MKHYYIQLHISCTHIHYIGRFRASKLVEVEIKVMDETRLFISPPRDCGLFLADKENGTAA